MKYLYLVQQVTAYVHTWEENPRGRSSVVWYQMVCPAQSRAAGWHASPICTLFKQAHRSHICDSSTRMEQCFWVHDVPCCASYTGHLCCVTYNKDDLVIKKISYTLPLIIYQTPCVTPFTCTCTLFINYIFLVRQYAISIWISMKYSLQVSSQYEDFWSPQPADWWQNFT
jgi:hypothetical protein